LYTLRLDSTAQSLDQVLWVQDNVESYNFYQRDNRLVLEIVTNTDYCPHCKYFYYWRDNDFESFDPEEPDRDAVMAAEEALLTRWQSEEAIPLLRDILDYPDYHGKPRIFYLLGLAYELAGDTQNAVQTYWELWHNYPESAYARLAQAKLELKR
jgi:tetratricopeptide (TPR) repeat protein